ncbi:MAG: universal stress protein [Acidimicrobiia bacterium]|nr:universal stress protein [Acidimicrobiia bacterium]
MGFSKLLVATDGSPGGDEAVRLAADVAVRMQIDVVLLHVYETAPAFVAGFEQPMALEVNDALESAARRVVKMAEEILADKGVTAASSRCVGGHVPSMILDVADSEGVDLIVLGHRGHGLSRFLLGSVADRVSHHAECAVLLAAPPESEG